MIGTLRYQVTGITVVHYAPDSKFEQVYKNTLRSGELPLCNAGNLWALKFCL